MVNSGALLLHDAVLARSMLRFCFRLSVPLSVRYKPEFCQMAKRPWQVIFRRQCNKLTLCTSGFVDDVVFSHNGPHGEGRYGNNDVGAVLQQVVQISNVFAGGLHAAWLCRRIHWQEMAQRGPSVMSTIALLNFETLFISLKRLKPCKSNLSCIDRVEY